MVMEPASGDRSEELFDTAQGLADTERDPVEALADDYVARRRRGEAPTIDEYTARCPERADEIRALFPAIAALERWKPQPASPPGKLPLQGRLGDCRLISEIGRGGMGVVYEAEQESLGRRVAVKVLPHVAWADDQPMQRFLREAKTAANLRHTNIVPVFGVGEEQGLHYYIMPLIPGVGLDRVVQALRAKFAVTDEGVTADSPADPRRAEAESIALALLDGTPAAGTLAAFGRRYWQAVARIGIQVADALEHAHEQGILHRDIKPANLLLDPAGTVWVTDFGLAKAMAHDDLSRTGDLVGTLRYMAPERFQGVCDARSDIYSLGLSLYELVTLRTVHLTGDRAEMVRQATVGQHPPPRALNPRIPRDLETVILKAVDPDLRFRYASAGALSADLARFCAGQPIEARRTAAPERLLRWMGRNRMVSSLAIIAIALALFGAYFFYLFLTAPPWARPPLRPFPPPPGLDGFPPPFR
jgi:serine/threonine protein kinase